MPTIPLPDQIDCVKREIGMRERVYPTWVQRRRMSQEQADRELSRMRAVLKTLEDLRSMQYTLHEENFSDMLKRLQEDVDRITRKRGADPLSQALNEGNGVYRP